MRIDEAESDEVVVCKVLLVFSLSVEVIEDCVIVSRTLDIAEVVCAIVPEVSELEVG